MHKLNELDVESNAAGMSDVRLNSKSNFKCGCGGIAVIWKESLDSIIFPSYSNILCAVDVN